ncbi:MAG: hypothetical protein U0270_15740 [Labilithrix sp.]
MRSVLIVSSILALSAGFAAFASGCTSESTDDPTASGENAATSAEISQARAAVALIAGAQAHCNQCHTASKQDIQRWGAQMKSIEETCLSPTLTLTNEQRIACLKEDGSFGAGKLGLYAAGVKTAQFTTLFGSDTAALADFQDNAGMPLGGENTLTDTQFASIKKWVLAGMPALDVALTDPDLEPCHASLTPALRTHMTKMATEGWGARLADAATPMFGCGDGAADQCLKTFPDITTTWSTSNANQTLRKLRDVPFRSHWWIRSSPDGKYTGFGLNNSAKLIDNSKPGANGIIDVKASYDPQFFPNNEGFSYAGVGSGNGPIKVCKSSVIANASSTNPITLNEPGCSTIISSVYQTVGAALDNHLYLMSTGTHVNDDAEASGSGPRAGFDGNASTILTPMVNDGNKFVPQRNVTMPLPFEGDQALSASNGLLLTRFGGKEGKRGYKIRKLTVTEQAGVDGGATTYSATSDVIGTVCANGAKPAMDYSERFIVSHQYVDPAANPDNLPLKSANIVMIDLLTGEVVRLTTMKDRQYAFAPHFRADGWIYFVVRDMNNTANETLVASDAALRRLAATPTVPAGSTH